MLIACVQSDVDFADTESNLRRVVRWMHLASDQSADLVVFPECMLTGYGFESRQEAVDFALSTDDDCISTIAATANKLGQLVTVGFVERDGQRLFNSAALIGKDGIVGLYRKIHLPHLGVDRFVDRGDRPYCAHLATQHGGTTLRIGLGICYDASFPEPMRVLGLDGADIIALGTNWPVEGIRTAGIVPLARSLENHLYFVAANRVGTERGVTYCGRSSICGPDGFLLASSDSDDECLLTADVDPAVARNKKIVRTQGTHTIDRFADRRPEFYGSIGKEPLN